MTEKKDRPKTTIDTEWLARAAKRTTRFGDSSDVERQYHLVCFYCGHLESEHPFQLEDDPASPWQHPLPRCLGKVGQNSTCECSKWKPMPAWEFQEMIKSEEEWIEQYGSSMKPSVSMWEKIKGWFR